MVKDNATSFRDEFGLTLLDAIDDLIQFISDYDYLPKLITLERDLQRRNNRLRNIILPTRRLELMINRAKTWNKYIVKSTNGFTQANRYNGALQNYLKKNITLSKPFDIILDGVGAHLDTSRGPNNISIISPQIEEIIRSIPSGARVNLRAIDVQKDFLDLAVFRGSNLLENNTNIVLSSTVISQSTSFRKNNKPADLIIATNVLYYSFKKGYLKSNQSLGAVQVNEQLASNTELVINVLKNLKKGGRLIVDSKTISTKLYFQKGAINDKHKFSNTSSFLKKMSIMGLNADGISNICLKTS